MNEVGGVKSFDGSGKRADEMVRAAELTILSKRSVTALSAGGIPLGIKDKGLPQFHALRQAFIKLVER